jgi:hypothetical protein
MPMQADFIVSDIVLAKDDKEEFHLIPKFTNIPTELTTLRIMDATRFESLFKMLRWRYMSSNPKRVVS